MKTFQKALDALDVAKYKAIKAGRRVFPVGAKVTGHYWHSPPISGHELRRVQGVIKSHDKYGGWEVIVQQANGDTVGLDLRNLQKNEA